MQYSQKTIEKLAAIAEEKGEYVAVSNYLGISQSQLLTKRRQYPELDIALKKAIKRHLANKNIPDNYEFSNEELEEITNIVNKGNVEQAAKKYGLSGQSFHDLRKKHPKLDEAITKGQNLRKGNTVFRRAMNLFGNFDAKQLEKLSAIAEDGGLEAVIRKYGFAAHSLNKCRQKLPELDQAIKAGLRKRPIGAGIASSNKERKTSKPYKKKDKFRKPPREIVDKTMLAVEDNSAAAWANFRQMVEERWAREHLKRARKGDYSDMIGL